MAGTLVALAFGPFGLSANSVGFNRDFSSGVLVGAGMGLVPVVAVALLLVSERARPVLADARLRGTRGWKAVYLTVVKIPLGTALVEEVAFRGVLLALLQPHGSLVAALVSSAAFGAWHVRPALNRLLAGNPGAARGARRHAVVTAVVLTFGAGMLFVFVRFVSGNLGVPIGLHAAVNSGAAVVGLTAHRLLRSAQKSKLSIPRAIV